VPISATATLSGGVDVVQASALIAFTGKNNDLVFTVKPTAVAGATKLLGQASNGVAIEFKLRGLLGSDSVTWNAATKVITFSVRAPVIAA
jgi:hypothetical protein